MRKLKNLIFVFIVMMFVSIINVDAAGVSVKSVKLVDSNGSATELSDPVPNGLDIKFDLSFSNVGDTATYEVVLNNTTNKEYEINTDKQFSRSNYISYSYELKDKTNRVKAKSEVTLYITIKYENPVPTSSLLDGKYVENNTMGINLLNEDNPSTFNNALFIILMLFMLLMATLIFKYTKNKGLFIIMLSLLLVPITVFALEKLKLTVSTKITIEEKYNIYYNIGEIIKTNDLNNPDIIPIECINDTRILNDNGSYDEYSYCEMVIKKDNKSYLPGERVTINQPNIYTRLDDSKCTEDSDNDIFICQSDALVQENHNCLSISCGRVRTKKPINDRLVWECTQEEFNSLNFEQNGAIPEWENYYGTVNFRIPNSFTMPRHDVVLENGVCR